MEGTAPETMRLGILGLFKNVLNTYYAPIHLFRDLLTLSKSKYVIFPCGALNIVVFLFLNYFLYLRQRH